MEDIITILTQTKLFQDLSSSTIKHSLMPHSNIRSFNPKECVIELLKPINSIGIILEGNLHTIQVFYDGSISLVDKLLPSYILGCDLICTKTKKAPYSVLSATASKVIFFPASLFLEPGNIIESERSKIVSHLLTHISQINMRNYYRNAILSQNSLRGRLMTYLSMQARRQNTPSFTIPFTREEMASFLCVNRSALSNELSKLKREGLLDYKKNQFTLVIQDPFFDAIFNPVSVCKKTTHYESPTTSKYI
ncbi:Crp/Fnr family transcriptional regulator [Acidaminobacter hydrogenoformans]|uniref:cAMP-binding domain of CRP or a regulatory subunit of cAMP-dependent protein kinases n=1 Tax=Acidaminobacter hydrogenoformans DSM 2784 TaxID=1120920 RepID=A0A1G5RZD2_9FIRM|nr:Crp/Fnr family transcriptional regulator [Acidaminobacter hydrogenoformans]SCZ79462.1 cAMP-binding domain of CRP or a regulatory subunit of cAMP-dependent protein kinases [Acidaminobacter hydrogenoformans DSM 2784]